MNTRSDKFIFQDNNEGMNTYDQQCAICAQIVPGHKLKIAWISDHAHPVLTHHVSIADESPEAVSVISERVMDKTKYNWRMDDICECDGCKRDDNIEESNRIADHEENIQEHEGILHVVCEDCIESHEVFDYLHKRVLYMYCIFCTNMHFKCPCGNEHHIPSSTYFCDCENFTADCDTCGIVSPKDVPY